MTTLHFPPLVSIIVKNYLFVPLFNRAGHRAIRQEIMSPPSLGRVAPAAGPPSPSRTPIIEVRKPRVRDVAHHCHLFSRGP